MTDLIIPILSIVAVTNIILCLFILSRGLRQLTNVLFGLIALASAFWSLAIIGFYSQQYRTQIDWITVTHVSAICISYFFLIFSINFPQKLFRSRILNLYLSLPAIILIYLLFNTNIIVGASSNFEYQIGAGYFFYGIVLIASFLSGYIFLLKQHGKTSDLNQKSQVKYVLIGSLTASTLAIVPDLILPFFNIFNYTWLGPILTLLMVVSIFLAILKYHLFDVKLILTELVSITIVVALIIELFFVGSIEELALKTVILIIVTCFSYILIRGVYREVAQREKIEALAKDLQTANDRLRELDKQKTEFISFATHQLRAPITAIKGYASLALEGDLGEVSAKVRDAIERVFESSKTMANVIDDYLNVSRIELGSMKYDFVPLDIKEMVGEVVAELKPNIEKTGLKFDWKAVGEGPWKVSADPDKLKQVIANIIDNSVKYTPAGSLSVALERVPNEGGTIPVRFSVTDTGIGIAPEVMPKLFQKFSRAAGANKQNIHGTGLGLFIAKEIVTAHKGRIWAESAGEGKGSKFIVELPAA